MTNTMARYILYFETLLLAGKQDFIGKAGCTLGGRIDTRARKFIMHSIHLVYRAGAYPQWVKAKRFLADTITLE